MTKVLDVPSEVPVAVDGHRAGSRPFVVASGTDSTSLLRWIYPLTAIASGLGLLGKVSLVARLLPLPPALLLVLIFVAMLLPLAWPYAIRYRFLIAPLVIAGLAGIFLVVFPKVQQMHSIGRGTDQPDCVIVASNELMVGNWPYQRDKLWSHNPMSCGPGWVALQAPVVKTAGYPVNLAAIWLVSLLAVRWALGWSSTASLLTLLGLSPGLWLAAANGTDFLSFGIAVAALIAVASRLEKRRWVFILLAGLVAQFRMPTLLVPAFFTRQTGRLAALTATGFALCCQVGFLYWNASSFIADGPLHILFKLTNAHLISSNRLLAALEITLPILAAALVVSYLEIAFKPRYSLLAYLSFLFFLPALLDLARKVHLYGTPLKTLAFWEGGMWVSACLPAVALALAAQLAVHQNGTGRKNIDSQVSA